MTFNMYAVLLDFWGTIFYPKISIEKYSRKRAEYLWRVLKKYGYHLDKDYVYEKMLESRRLVDKIRSSSFLEVTHKGEVIVLLDKLRISADENLVKDLAIAFIRPYYLFTKPARDLDFFIEWLYDLGWPIGLVSNTMYGKATRRILSRYGLRKYFKVLALSDEVGFRKPHPKIFRYALKYLRVKPKNVIMIGDEIYDIYGAKTLGMKTIQYIGFRREKIEIADFKARSFKEIIQYIENNLI